MSDKSRPVPRPAEFQPTYEDAELDILLSCNGWKQAGDGHLMVTMAEDIFREFVAAYRAVIAANARAAAAEERVTVLAAALRGLRDAMSEDIIYQIGFERVLAQADAALVATGADASEESAESAASEGVD